MEKGWGGTPLERLNARYRAYESRYGTSAPKPTDENPVASADARAEAAGSRPLPEQTEAAAPRPEDPSQPTSPAPTPAATTATPAAGTTP